MPDHAKDLARYDLFGWDYAAINPLSDDEVGWHLHWAERTGGSILGLACGSARLLCRMAEAGYDVTGIDLSETMLDIARSIKQGLSPEAQKRMNLLQDDMVAFNLERKFGLVLIPDNSFRELPTRKMLLQCLRAVRRHLRADGRLLITERRFRSEMYRNGVRSFGWSDWKQDPKTGSLVRRRGHVHLHTNHRRLSGTFEYEVKNRDGRLQTHHCPWSGPVLKREEYISLFSRAGLKTEVYADYDIVPGTKGGNLWCFVCSSC